MLGKNKKEAPKCSGSCPTPAPAKPPHRPATRAKAGGPAAADAGAFSAFGAPVGWNPAEYGEYYAASTPVYAAIRLRADALARPPVVVYRRAPAQPAGQQRLPVAGAPGAAATRPRQPLVHPGRPLARHRDLPQPLGICLLDAGPRRPRRPRAVALRPDRVPSCPTRTNTYGASSTTGAAA